MSNDKNPLTANSSQSNSVESYVTPSSSPIYTSSSSIRPHHTKQLLTIVLLVVVVLILSFGGLVFAQNSQGQTHLSRAETLVAKADYKNASIELNKVSTLFITSKLKARIITLKNKITPWAEDQKKLELAQQYYDQGRYDEAGGLLNQIGPDFPGHPQVLALASKVSSQSVIVKKSESIVPKASIVAPAVSAKQSQDPTSSQPVTGAKRFTSIESLKALANATTVAQAEAAIQTFLTQYSLVLRVDQSAESDYAKTYVTFNTLNITDLAALKNYGALFINEWAKYPVSWVKASQLKDIYLVKNLVVSSTTRAAMPDPFGDAVFYDINYSGDYAKEVVHHEYDHVITYNFYGQYSPPDPVWQAFNPVNFAYGNGGASCYVPGNACLTGIHPIPGFVSGYAASEISEDKAEVYGYLMDSNYYHDLKGWIVNDKALANKVNNYKQFMASRSPEMSGTYFDDINP